MHCFFCFHLRDLSSWFGVVRNTRFLFRSNPGCGWWCSWGSAQNSLCELQLPMPKTPWFFRGEKWKLRVQIRILRYFWRFSVGSWKWDFITTDSQNDPNNKNVAQWYIRQLSVSQPQLEEVGQAPNREATEGRPDAAQWTAMSKEMEMEWRTMPLLRGTSQKIFLPLHCWMRSYCGHLAQLQHMPTSGLPFALLRPLSKSLTLTYCPIQEARSRAQSAHSVASSTCYPRLVS